MGKPPELTILGAGVAGLAVGYYAKKNGMLFNIYEASDHIGGNSITLEYNQFFFDSGAHRFHDRYPEITREVQMLLGDSFYRINIPSQIYSHRKFIDFPISPLNLLKNIGISSFLQSGFDVITSKWSKNKGNDSFESYALNTYGKTVASQFLLNYSEKLWGKPCNELSPEVAGKRLKGLDLKTFLVEAISGNRAKTEHLDGSFFYPLKGIGMIAECIAKCCGEQRIFKNSRVSKIWHNDHRVRQIEINGRETMQVQELVSTLPISLFIPMLEPRPPTEILSLAKTLEFRHVILIALFINKPTITNNASIYFPEIDIPFTRIYEPKNRSRYMSPGNQTSLIAEIPCQGEDVFWQFDDEKMAILVRDKICEFGMINQQDVIDSKVYRMQFAYPVLELGVEEKIRRIQDYLNKFENLKVTGRNGKFVYTHIHDMLKFGHGIVSDYVGEENPLL